MTLRTPLDRVRGLGTAKDGTDHWWVQRLTAVALIPLSFLFVALIWSFSGADRDEVVELMGNPFIASVMILFVIAGIYHAKLGVQVVIEDYIHGEGLKIASLALLSLTSFALGTASVISVLILAWGG
jgi:succinate dehydrogenase / fumarate reductase membrane anchor subunit